MHINTFKVCGLLFFVERREEAIGGDILLIEIPARYFCPEGHSVPYQMWNIRERAFDCRGENERRIGFYCGDCREVYHKSELREKLPETSRFSLGGMLNAFLRRISLWNI